MEDEPFPNICRACMTDVGAFQSIFMPDDGTDDRIHLAEMIMSYASVQITLGDGLPEQICLACAQQVSEFYLFKLKCENTDKNLRIKLGKSPLRLDEEEGYSSTFDVDNDPLEVIVKAENMTVAREEATQVKQTFDTVETLETVENEPATTHEFFVETCLETSDDPRPDDGGSDGAELEAIIANDAIDQLLQVKAEYTACNTFCDNGETLVATYGVASYGKAKYICELCKKRFNKNSHLTRHMKIHATVKPHLCVLCNRGFARPEQLSYHMNIHSGKKPHVCKICSKGFNQISNLKDHMRTHNGEKPFLCSTCGKGFNQLGNLRQHTVRHSGIKAHLCSVCGNGFASKGELGAHLRKHTGARPFVCSVCNHGFTTSSSLTKHKRIHSGEKPYECEVCKMKFSRSGILARHKRTHTGEKPYVCSFCTKAFSQSNDLSSHLRIHTGEKPYICDVCGQAFRQSSALKTHKKTHIDKSTLLDSKVVISMMHSTFLNTL